jgi:hypothetical protein
LSILFDSLSILCQFFVDSLSILYRFFVDSLSILADSSSILEFNDQILLAVKKQTAMPRATVQEDSQAQKIK